VVGRRRSELRETPPVRAEGVEVVRRDHGREQRDEHERECDPRADPQHRARHSAGIGDRSQRPPDAAEAARCLWNGRLGGGRHQCPFQ
jgi:hypothetical protein